MYIAIHPIWFIVCIASHMSQVNGHKSSITDDASPPFARGALFLLIGVVIRYSLYIISSLRSILSPTSLQISLSTEMCTVHNLLLFYQ